MRKTWIHTSSCSDTFNLAATYIHWANQFDVSTCIRWAVGFRWGRLASWLSLFVLIESQRSRTMNQSNEGMKNQTVLGWSTIWWFVDDRFISFGLGYPIQNLIYKTHYTIPVAVHSVFFVFRSVFFVPIGPHLQFCDTGIFYNLNTGLLRFPTRSRKHCTNHLQAYFYLHSWKIMIYSG